MADFAAVVKELESQNKVLGDIKRNTAKPKKDAGDREIEKENAQRDGQTNVLLSSILGEIKGGGLGKAKSGGNKKGGGFSFGNLKLGAIAGGIAGLATAIMGFIMNPFGLILKAGKWALKLPLRVVGWSIKKIATALSSAIGSALKTGWGLLKDFAAPKLAAVGQSLKTLATRASSAIGNALKSGWGFIKDFAGPKLAAVGESLKTLATRASDAIKGGLKAGWGFAKDMTLKAVDLGKDALTKTTTFLKNMGSKGLEAAKSGMKTAWGFAKDGTMKAIDLGKNAASGLKDIALKASSSISNAVSGLWQGAKGAGGKVISLATELGKAGISKATHGVGMLKNFAVSGANSVKTALTGVMGKITGLPATGTKGAGKVAATIGKTMLKGAKFIPGAGLAVTGALALYEGFSAGFDTYKKTGNFSKAVKDGASGALSSLTFGLVSKETISSGFDAIGSQYTKLTDGVVKVAGEAWTGVKKLIPTKESMTKAWNAVGTKLAPLKDITLPKEFSVAEVKKSLSSVGTSLNAAVKNFTGLDINNIVTKFPKLSDISALLPNWLTAPAKWLAGWFKTSDVPSNPEELKAKGEVDSLQKELAQVQMKQRLGARDIAAGNARMMIKKLEKRQIGGQKWLDQGGKGKGAIDLYDDDWRDKFDATGIKSQKETLAKEKKQIEDYKKFLKKRDAKKDAIQKKAAELKAALEKKQAELKKIQSKKQTGGSFSGFDPFIAHEGELIMPRQSSGLVLNRAATNAIMSAGMNRLAAANQGDAQGGGSPTLINAPKVTNSTTTQTAMPISRPLPIVQSMVG